MKYYISIDIGGTSMKAAILDEKGTILKHDCLEVKNDFTFLMEQIESYVQENKKLYQICGLALSTPGAVDSTSGIIYGYSALPCIHGPNWKKELVNRVKLPISIANDANCAGMAELFNGSAKGCSDVIMLVCGSGIGGCIIKDGNIHFGSHLFGGEFGYMVMEYRNQKPYTYSDLASSVSIQRRMQEQDHTKNWTSEMVFLEAEMGNQSAQRIINEYFHYLALGIFNIQHMYDPEIILIGGAISEREGFIDAINQQLNQILKAVEISKLMPKVAICTYKKDANIIGAFAHHLNEVKQY